MGRLGSLCDQSSKSALGFATQGDAAKNLLYCFVSSWGAAWIKQIPSKSRETALRIEDGFVVVWNFEGTRTEVGFFHFRRPPKLFGAFHLRGCFTVAERCYNGTATGLVHLKCVLRVTRVALLAR